MPRERSAAPAQQVVVANSLFAAATNLSIRKAKGKNPKIKTEGWQTRAWYFYDVIGEFRYSVNWVGNLVSKAKLYPTKNGEPTTDAAAVEAMDMLFGGEEGQSEMLRQIAIHLTVGGDCYVTGLDGGAQDDIWMVLSGNQISNDGTGYKIDKEHYDGALAIKVWEPHPRDYKKPDSPSRAVLPILAELEGLTKRVAAEIDSRLAGAGILFIPSEISFPAGPTSLGTNPEDPTAVSDSRQNAAESFIDMLVDVMSTAIGDRESAAAMVPIVLQVPGEFIDKVKHITFWSELDAESINLRTEAIRRLALGMDMPPEVLTGTGDLNHWNAWQMEEAAIKAHSEPLLQRIAASLATGYLRPFLEDGGMDDEDSAEYGIGVDTTALRLRPNRSKEAEELYDRGVLSRKALLRENGFDPDDEMDPKELSTWFIRKVASGSTTPELVQAALEALGVPLEIEAPVAEVQEARPTPSLEGHPDNSPPEMPQIPLETVAASEVMLFRALERAGNRMKNKFGAIEVPKCPAADLYQHVPVDPADLDDLLFDAWSCGDRFDYDVPRDRLDSYARSLILSRQPHDRNLLRSYLALTGEVRT